MYSRSVLLKNCVLFKNFSWKQSRLKNRTTTTMEVGMDISNFTFTSGANNGSDLIASNFSFTNDESTKTNMYLKVP